MDQGWARTDIDAFPPAGVKEFDDKEMMDIELKEIKGKKVYIFESHHYALLPWAELKRSVGNKDWVGKMIQRAD